eukprot:scaffold10364_cov155-Skeletonema_dohrnii-CCMP3373.AAC.5
MQRTKKQEVEGYYIFDIYPIGDTFVSVVGRTSKQATASSKHTIWASLYHFRWSMVVKISKGPLR